MDLIDLRVMTTETIKFVVYIFEFCHTYLRAIENSKEKTSGKLSLFVCQYKQFSIPSNN